MTVYLIRDISRRNCILLTFTECHWRRQVLRKTQKIKNIGCRGNKNWRLRITKSSRNGVDLVIKVQDCRTRISPHSLSSEPTPSGKCPCWNTDISIESFIYLCNYSLLLDWRGQGDRVKLYFREWSSWFHLINTPPPSQKKSLTFFLKDSTSPLHDSISDFRLNNSKK